MLPTMMTPDPEGTPAAILSWDDYIRARACVNACAGIPTDDLERCPSGGLFHLADMANEVVKQRDELLAALEQFLDPEGNPPEDTGEWREVLRVITSAKELK